MDMITVDITDHDEIKNGDTVILFGEDLTINDIAKYSNCVPWDLLTPLQSRVTFQWTAY
jgi:alanine racemase